jgi:hypothetical protein
MDDNLAGGYIKRKVQHKGAASFFDSADEELDFANVFTGSSGVDFHYVSFVFNFIKLLVHHHNSDSESRLGVKLNYFMLMNYSAVLPCAWVIAQPSCWGL